MVVEGGVIMSCVLQAATDARARALGPLSPTFNIHNQLRAGLSLVLPPDAHVRVNGRLLVSLTRVSDGRNVLLSRFWSRQELIEALLCTSFIPFFSGLRPGKVRGVRYIDGGFSDNTPVTSPVAVTVSPFAGEADICPADNSASMMAESCHRLDGGTELLSGGETEGDGDVCAAPWDVLFVVCDEMVSTYFSWLEKLTKKPG
ncbi:patatin-like phospholipase domain-containing protein 2 [Hyalella azteca]|uniref:Patatin-like phospholipase domain-containing protein 2 n=1 Tax=Hyalella azteca TaxID=294128 RepID=A0A979FLN3_HYAAZ|nr:patatin-like phospholipase domain-containing protein 2 [Hyalella azteca]